jgi:hypothetical protein
MHRKKFPAKAQKAVFAYIRKYGKRCFYTNVLLELNDDTSPWYLDFDHWLPGDPKKIVICAALVNDMKQDMTEREFWYYVCALDDHRKKHAKVKKHRLIYWYRLPVIPAKAGIQRRCPICGKPTSNRWHKYCPQCSTVAKRLVAEHFSPKTKNGVFGYLHTYRFVDYYTGIELEAFDTHSPWYLTFDHYVPSDPRKLVVTSRMVNAMKQDLTEVEFWDLISQFARHHREGTQVKRIKLKYWSRPYGK